MYANSSSSCGHTTPPNIDPCLFDDIGFRPAGVQIVELASWVLTMKPTIAQQRGATISAFLHDGKFIQQPLVISGRMCLHCLND